MMDDTPARRFFLQPAANSQRLYEALRAVCIEDCRQKDVAERFGYDYAAFRQQVTRFRARCAAGRPSPFLPHRPVTNRLPFLGSSGMPNCRQLPTAVP
jgi:hypothetical protein